MGFSRQEYWGGFPFPPPGDLPGPGIKLASSEFPVLQANSLLMSHWGSPVTLCPETRTGIYTLLKESDKCE